MLRFDEPPNSHEKWESIWFRLRRLQCRSRRDCAPFAEACGGLAQFADERVFRWSWRPWSQEKPRAYLGDRELASLDKPEGPLIGRRRFELAFGKQATPDKEGPMVWEGRDLRAVRAR